MRRSVVVMLCCVALWGGPASAQMLAKRLDLSAAPARGLVAWWRAMPSVTGGTYYYDLLGRTTGTLTNATWGATTRPGGYAEVRFNGTNGQVVIPASAVLDTPALSYVLWMRAASTGNYGTLAAVTGAHRS